MEQIDSVHIEQINSKRKPIKKIDAMTPKEFIAFLKEFLPYVKNGKVDLNDIRITQKIDGAAIALSWINNDMYFESSYSGITKWDKLPFPDAGKFLYETYYSYFQKIAEKYGDFKIKGELIWINGMEENGKVTPVAASYLTEKFGKYGGIVIFDIYKIENGKLTDFSEVKEKLVSKMIEKLSNNNFTFYLNKKIILNQNVTFTLDVDQLLSLVNNPEYNKDRFIKKRDEKIIEEIEKIKETVTDQLSNIIDKSGGAFSTEGDLIEGIVLRINSSGNQYGIFSRGYRQLKKKLWEKTSVIKSLYAQFLTDIFGYAQPRFIKYNWNKLNIVEAQNKLNSIKNDYINSIENIINQMKEAPIPSCAKNTQLGIANGILNKIKDLNSIEQFGNKLFEQKQTKKS